MTLEVYEEVTAVVSPKVIDAILKSSNDALLTLHKHVRNAHPAHVLHGENTQYTLTGSLEDIITARDELCNMLKSFTNSQHDVASVQNHKSVSTPDVSLHSIDRTHKNIIDTSPKYPYQTSYESILKQNPRKLNIFVANNSLEKKDDDHTEKRMTVYQKLAQLVAQPVVEQPKQDRQMKSEDTKMISDVVSRDPGYSKLRKIQAAQAISRTIATSQNRENVNSDYEDYT